MVTGTAPDRHAAHTVAAHPEQGWSLLCNGAIVFADMGLVGDVVHGGAGPGLLDEFAQFLGRGTSDSRVTPATAAPEVAEPGGGGERWARAKALANVLWGPHSGLARQSHRSQQGGGAPACAAPGAKTEAEIPGCAVGGPEAGHPPGGRRAERLGLGCDVGQHCRQGHPALYHNTTRPIRKATGHFWTGAKV